MAFGFSRKRKNSDDDGEALSDLSSGSNGRLNYRTSDVNTAEAVRISSPGELESNHELAFKRRSHHWDPNMDFDFGFGDDLKSPTQTLEDLKAEQELVDILENDSPYPEVRAAVRNYDEDLPSNTIRAWTIGMLMVTLGSGMNMLFHLRSPSIVVTSFVAQLIAYPIGKLWDLIMPKFLCNGRFNMKEHALITIMANISFGGGAAYGTDIIVAMKAYYGYDFGWGFHILVTLGTQMVGYGFAGLLRRFLVWPSSMIWPTNFVNTSLFYALHDHSATDPRLANGWKVPRFRYFFYVFAGAFAWYWVPGWLFQALSYCAFATWIAPNNVVVNQLFGYSSGLGLIPLTFDWTQITGFTLSPLMFPWHGIANTLIGVIIFYTIGSTALHYSGWAWSTYLPMSTGGAYDNTGGMYNVSRILTDSMQLDVQKYNEYSPLFLSTTFAVAYGLSFASITALISHTALFHGQELWIRCKASMGEVRGEEPDNHFRMMRKYAQVPFWWYLILFSTTCCCALVSVLAFDTSLPWWAFLLAILISLIFFVPIGMIQAITNIQLGLNVVTEFIIGYMLPGRPLAMMLFKTYGYITMFQGLAFAQDLKLGHYMKLPPRTLFSGQVIATLWSSIVQIAVLNWAFGNIPDLCSPDQSNHYTCPGGRVFFNASIIWGVIGPARMFSPGQTYHALLYFFLAGFLLPPIIYTLARLFPRSSIRYLNAPLLFGGAGMIPPASVTNYTTWAAVGWFFNKFLKNKYRGWWSNYNYLTSAALDTGLAVCTILIFFSLQMWDREPPAWWGNDVITTTLDWNNEAVLKVVAEGEVFGPRNWAL